MSCRTSFGIFPLHLIINLDDYHLTLLNPSHWKILKQVQDDKLDIPSGTFGTFDTFPPFVYTKCMLHKLALNVPGLSGDTNIPNPEGLQFSGPAQTSVGYVLSQFLNLTFTIAIILSFIWFVWGAYEYIVAQGQKEALSAAKERIRYSLVGFIILVAAFLIGNWAPTIFPFIRSFYDNANVPQIQDTGNIQGQPCEAGKPC